MPSSVSPVQSLKGRLAVLHRDHAPDSSEILTVRRDLAAAKLEQYVERTLATLPPLTDEQCARVAALLRGGAR